MKNTKTEEKEQKRIKEQLGRIPLSKEQAKKYALKNIFPKDNFWKKI